MTLAAAPMKYLDRAMTELRSLGLPAPKDVQAPAVGLVTQLAKVDEGRVISISRVLQYSGHFNELMRDQISTSRVSDRYTEVVRGFDSIRDDARRMVDQMADGKIDLREKMQNVWMAATRGDIPTRFAKIKKTYLEVVRDSSAQIEREKSILNMYIDFRFSMKEAEIQAAELLKMQEAILATSKAALEKAQAEVAAADQADGALYGRLAMTRDESIRAVQDEDGRYQIAKDLADNLQVAYAASEAVMARVMQSHEIKKRVNQRAVSFFSTNETVFTALNAAFTTQSGLHESTQTLSAMTDGISKGLESIADTGDEILKAGLKAGYGSTIRVESVKKLVDAVVNFQETSLREIEDLRVQSSKDAAEISDYVEQGKKRFTALMQPGAAGELPDASAASLES